MSDIALTLNEQDRGDLILRNILLLAHDDDNEDNRIVALKFLAKLSITFGTDLCE